MTHDSTDAAGAPSPGSGAGDGRAVPDLDDLGGDPACWLARVCQECGRLTEGRDPTHCAACGQPLS